MAAMSKDKEPGTGALLSKFVKFVKNPATDWTRLDETETPDPSHQALKEMIERKRRNDFVRNREFNMLRKIRRRESLSASELHDDRPSIQSGGLSSDKKQARAMTIEKIDAIEAQMAGNWFGGKSGADTRPPQKHDLPGVSDAVKQASSSALSRHVPPENPLVAAPNREVVLLDDSPERQQHPAFAPTIGMEELAKYEQQQIDPQPMLDIAFPGGDGQAPGMPGFAPGSASGAAVLQPDPELDDAAIRFANGDIGGAETSLVALVSDGGARSDDMQTWLALFDFYRASGKQCEFDDASIRFASRFGRSAPQWALPSDLPLPEEEGASTASSPRSAVSRWKMTWSSPSALTLQSLAALGASLERSGQPWRIDWSHIKSIDEDALPALQEVLNKWGGNPVELRMRGAGVLLELLEQQAPLEERTADPAWWMCRMALLRVMHEVDEFELVALNYCVTYEVSPPSWEEPRCQYLGLDTEGVTIPASLEEMKNIAAAAPDEASDDASGALTPTVDMGWAKGVLYGEILEDAEAALAPVTALCESESGVRAIVLNCRQLQRMDFGAAGSLLNWINMQHSLQREVTLAQVNRMVGAFFVLLGIHEVARVLIRPD
jgi:ABC-type transporter Mla MlaB component